MSTLSLIEALVAELTERGPQPLADVLVVLASGRPPPKSWCSAQLMLYDQLMKRWKRRT